MQFFNFFFRSLPSFSAKKVYFWKSFYFAVSQGD